MFNLKVLSKSEEIDLQMEFGPPPPFKTIDDAVDWSITHLPYGAEIEIYDGRKALRASGYVTGKIQFYKKEK